MLAVTSSEATIRRTQHYQQEHGRHFTTVLPKRRHPVPLDCSEGLQLCRDNLHCRTLLDTMDRVCDQSSTPLCSRVFETKVSKYVAITTYRVTVPRNQK